LEAVIGCVERVWGEKWDRIRDRHGDRARDLVLYLGRNVCGLKLLELARAAGVREYATVAMAVKRYREHLQADVDAQKQLKRVMRMLHLHLKM
jgi:chromosomal replication initiation ATPase DnaA